MRPMFGRPAVCVYSNSPPLQLRVGLAGVNRNSLAKLKPVAIHGGEKDEVSVPLTFALV